MLIVFVIAGVVVLLAGAAMFTAIAGAGFKRASMAEAAAVLTSQPSQTHIVQEGDIKDLPEVVQRYLHYTCVVGRETVSTVRLKYTAAMRLSPNGPWKSLEAVEYYGVPRPGFVWLGRASVMPLLSVTARDSYVNNRGRMTVKMLSAFTLADSRGSEMDYSGLVRYLNEMMWFPTGFLNKNIVWEAIDCSSARVTITDGGISASAVLCFDERGAITNFIGERFHNVNGKLTRDTWTTPITGYSDFDGMRLPARGEATWKMASGDFCYFRLKLSDIQYNVPEIYSR